MEEQDGKVTPESDSILKDSVGHMLTPNTKIKPIDTAIFASPGSVKENFNSPEFSAEGSDSHSDDDNDIKMIMREVSQLVM